LAITGGGLGLLQIGNAGAQAGDYELVCNSDGVRLRAEPGLSSNVIGSIRSGDVVNVTGVTVFADGYGWVPMFVQRTGQSGYAAGDFFDRAGGGSGWIRGTPVHVTSDGVNLRSGPGLGYAVIGNFSTGTNAVVADGPRSADGYSWYNILHDDYNGWMAADFLAEGYSGSPGPSPSPGKFPIGAYVRPTGALNLRTGAGTGNSVIRVIDGDDIATVVGGPQVSGGYTWYQIELWDQAATTGWAAGEYLEGARFEPTGARHQVVDGPLNLREWGSLSAPVIRTLANGTIMVIADASFTKADGYTWMLVYLEADPSVTGRVATGFSVEI
jgi:uncharacterized protein YgiM (DUF1202 family)